MNNLNPEYTIEGVECAGCFICGGCLGTDADWSALMLIGLATMVYVG
ncbi:MULTISPECIES: hypothetical protein [Petrotoga]|uniref:Uncharacterized protein n=2 Tax=Petrotoga olearia TaxID=156203 RepID=A0A2K1P171_9BACT|nr:MULTISPECIES: hypothetical protein [Petrotoga]PNR96545.1 hypothetical protein X929_04480 [Petrotoga olearia DSM 13574]RMA76583.1 hypothetical protein C8D75_0236 [Petrotoga olearia]